MLHNLCIKNNIHVDFNTEEAQEDNVQPPPSSTLSLVDDLNRGLQMRQNLVNQLWNTRQRHSN